MDNVTSSEVAQMNADILRSKNKDLESRVDSLEKRIKDLEAIVDEHHVKYLLDLVRGK